MFSDTVQCPACRHILDESKHVDPERENASASTASDEKPCPNCREMVRVGLVRCWNCSAFMQDDIAESYRRMQSTPQPVIYSQVPAEIAESGGGQPEEQTFHAEDRDFELSVGVGTRQQESRPTTQPVPDQPGSDVYSIAQGAAIEDTGVEETGKTTAEEPAHEPSAEAHAAGTNGDTAKPAPEEPDVDHSVATGGDALLKVALQEEAELKRRRRMRKERRKVGPRSETGLLVFCPNGHRVEVQERHRGLAGRCPKCKSPFFVPAKPVPQEAAAEATEPADAKPSDAAGKYEHWMTDVRVHSVNPERLKLKANSLKNEFRLFDLGFADDELLALSFTKKKGSAGATSKKRLGERDAMRAALREGKPLEETPVVESTAIDAENARLAKVVQPAAYAHESMFAGIEVFGEKWIAVRIAADLESEPLFISFPLSQFRQFAELMSKHFGVNDLGEDCGVPLKDSFNEVQCHYSEEKFQVLEKVEFYQADPAFEIELAGRRCKECGLIVSEDSRKKEKIGGANGKAIAKALCPKCKKKFGDISLFALKAAPETETPADAGENVADQSAGEPAAESATATAQT